MNKLSPFWGCSVEVWGHRCRDHFFPSKIFWIPILDVRTSWFWKTLLQFRNAKNYIPHTIFFLYVEIFWLFKVFLAALLLMHNITHTRILFFTKREKRKFELLFFFVLTIIFQVPLKTCNNFKRGERGSFFIENNNAHCLFVISNISWLIFHQLIAL